MENSIGLGPQFLQVDLWQLAGQLRHTLELQLVALSVDIRTQSQGVHPVLRPGDFSADTSHGNIFLRQYIQIQVLCHLTINQVTVASAVVEDQDFLVLDPQRLHCIEGRLC